MLSEDARFIYGRLHTPPQGGDVDRVVVIHLVAAHPIVITDTILDAHRYLDRVRPVCPRVVVPLPAAGVEFTAVQREDRAIGCGGRR